MVSSFEPFSGNFFPHTCALSLLHVCMVCMCTYCKMHDDFGLRLIFTLSAALTIHFVFTIINLSYVILLFFVLFRGVFFSISFFLYFCLCLLFSFSHCIIQARRLRFFHSSRRVDESHLSDLCFPFIISSYFFRSSLLLVYHIFSHQNVSKQFPLCVSVVRPCDVS